MKARTGLQQMLILPILIFLASVIAGIDRYTIAKSAMQKDLNLAMRQMIGNKDHQRLLLDSLSSLQAGGVLTPGKENKLFCGMLSLSPLKETSHLALCIQQSTAENPFRERANICSDTLLWSTQLEEGREIVVALKAFANPSMAAVLQASDQRFPVAGLLLSLLLATLMFRKRQVSVEPTDGGQLIRVAVPEYRSLRLTPMQKQLMAMFTAAPHHTLSKQEICDALWPRKDRPEDTLYTFISRMKTTLERQSGMRITNTRSKEYTLIIHDVKD